MATNKKNIKTSYENIFFFFTKPTNNKHINNILYENHESITQNKHMTHDIFGPLQAPFNMACNMCDKME